MWTILQTRWLNDCLRPERKRLEALEVPSSPMFLGTGREAERDSLYVDTRSEDSCYGRGEEWDKLWGVERAVRDGEGSD